MFLHWRYNVHWQQSGTFLFQNVKWGDLRGGTIFSVMSKWRADNTRSLNLDTANKVGGAPKYRIEGCSRYWRLIFTTRKWLKCCFRNQCSRSRAVNGWARIPFCVILWGWLKSGLTEGMRVICVARVCARSCHTNVAYPPVPFAPVKKCPKQDSQTCVLCKPCWKDSIIYFYKAPCSYTLWTGQNPDGGHFLKFLTWKSPWRENPLKLRTLKPPTP